MKSKLTFFVILFVTYVSVYPQDSLFSGNRPRHFIQVDGAHLFFGDLSMHYSLLIKNRYRAEAVLGYWSAGKNTDNKILFISFDDPFWIYNQLSTRVGIGKYIGDGFYITPMLLFNYRFFNRKFFDNYVDFEGDQFDVDYVMSRNKKDFGALIKAGYSYRYKKLITDLYFGIGIKGVFNTEIIYKKLDMSGELLPDRYPIVTHGFKMAPTFHAGLLIGLAFPGS